MSDKNQSSQEVQNFIRDAKNLYTSAVAMIKKTIADYKTPAEIKPTENSTPTPPSANVIDSQPPIEQQPEQQTQQQPEQQSEQPPVQQSPIVDSESTTKDTENKL